MFQAAVRTRDIARGKLRPAIDSVASVLDISSATFRQRFKDLFHIQQLLLTWIKITCWIRLRIIFFRCRPALWALAYYKQTVTNEALKQSAGKLGKHTCRKEISRVVAACRMKRFRLMRRFNLQRNKKMRKTLHAIASRRCLRFRRYARRARIITVIAASIPSIIRFIYEERCTENRSTAPLQLSHARRRTT